MEEKTIKSKRLYRGKIINLRRDEVLLPRGRKGVREVVEHPGAVAIVPLLEEDKVILVRQYRKAVEESLWEIPAGKMEEGEGTEMCAQRELEEETGFRAGKLEELLKFYPSPGISTEVIHIFLGADLVKSQRNPEEDEFLELSTPTLEETLKWIKEGKIRDAKTVIGLLYLYQTSHFSRSIPRARR